MDKGPRGPKPKSAAPVERPARPERVEPAARRAPAKAAKPARAAKPSAERQRPVREERSSPSRMKRARVHREERSGTDRPERDSRPRTETRAAPPVRGRSGRQNAPRPARQREREPEPELDREPVGLPESHSHGAPQRIAKLLARAGVASRREIERMIADKRIASDGVIIDTPATILTSLQGVTVDGKPVSAPSATRLFLFHKPAGYLTAANDPAGRRTIYDRLPQGLPRVVPVGRLDLNTEGLLLLTNDGEFKRQLELPLTGVVRSYRARVFGEISQGQLEELIHGVEIEGMRYGSIDANLERRTGRNGWIEMRLTEGKNREVRRVLEYLGLQVSRLIRTSYGPFELGDLPVGMVDEVRQHELVAFRKTLK